MTVKNKAPDHHVYQNAFSMLGLLITSFVLLLVAFRQILNFHSEDFWEMTLFKAMLIYLVFILFRTSILLLLSFSDRFFKRKAKALTHFPLVSVIVPCFNEEEVIQKAVQSVLNLNYPNFEVIIVDDGSTDLTLTLANTLLVEKRVRVIYQRNQGKAEALNRGIEEALGEFVLCVDADSLIDSDVILNGLPYFEDDPLLGAVAGSVKVGNEKNILTRFQELEYIVGLNFHKSAQSFLSMVTIVPGPIGLFRKKAIQAIGGYHSNTFAEDCDLTIRLLLAGYRTVYCPLMTAITEAPEDFESLMKQRYRWSRGTLQAIKVNAVWLFQPWKSSRNFLLLFYMLVETMFIPSINFLFIIFFIQNAATSSNGLILGPYFIQLTLLDVILVAYSVFQERSSAGLIFLAFINRLTYGLSMEVLRFFSLVDELVGLPMNWNKLQRKGIS